AERAHELGVAQRRRQRRDLELEANARHDPPVAALEEAGPVPEPAIAAGPGGGGARDAVVDANARDRLGDLLAVGAHVLNGRPPDEAGDPAQALEAAPAFVDRARDDRAPGPARGHVDTPPIALAPRLDAARAQARDEAGEPAVPHD